MTLLDELMIQLHPPTAEWILSLKVGNFVWLVKEQKFAVVECEYEPPPFGHCAGQIVISICQRIVNTDRWGLERSQKWYVRPNGSGLDTKRLMLPVAGYLSMRGHADASQDVFRQQIYDRITQLECRNPQE